ncbi:unnamed protein product [Rotaria magnacalcarata]|uniref:MIF4G domain-containing protein n=2 Tax=Rotaria magnacalcarata TaxID=392030 RepID=A0A816QJV1_9BILA|nr:unnamed protein product [Rotaria magnacalcarata]CAF2060868.1 unnamed protein product [Rotaria magnacalcarata]CAF3988518.1 unnamed protein product [Rotaria magnacalcarata]
MSAEKHFHSEASSTDKLKNSNVPKIARKLFKHNITRGRSLVAKAIIDAQNESPRFTPVYAALISIINSKFPLIGQLICKRVISSLRNAYMADENEECFAMTKLLAHLMNQRVLNYLVVIQLLHVVLENYTDDSVKLAIGLLKECGQHLSKVIPQELVSVFAKLDNLLYEPSLNKHTQDMIQVLFTVRRDGFETYPSIQSDLDLIDTNDQYTHMLELLDLCDPEKHLHDFLYDAEYEANEDKYKETRKTILGDNDDDKLSSNASSNEDQSMITAAKIDTSSSSPSDNDKEN